MKALDVLCGIENMAQDLTCSITKPAEALTTVLGTYQAFIMSM